MDGAVERDKRAKALVWAGAMLPHMKDPPTFEQFTGLKADRAEQVRRWAAAWDKIDKALARH